MLSNSSVPHCNHCFLYTPSSPASFFIHLVHAHIPSLTPAPHPSHDAWLNTKCRMQLTQPTTTDWSHVITMTLSLIWALSAARPPPTFISSREIPKSHSLERPFNAFFPQQFLFLSGKNFVSCFIEEANTCMPLTTPSIPLHLSLCASYRLLSRGMQCTCSRVRPAPPPVHRVSTCLIDSVTPTVTFCLSCISLSPSLLSQFNPNTNTPDHLLCETQQRTLP